MKKKRRELMIVAIIMVIILAGAGAIGSIASCNQKKPDSTTVDPYYDGAMDIINGKTEPTNPPSNEQETESGNAEEVTVDPEPVAPDNESGSESDGTESGENDSGQSGNPVTPADPGGSSSSGTSGETKNTDQDTKVPTLPIPAITFPYKDDATGILVEQLSNYNGYYIEDGKDEPVSNVAAIVVTNRSKSDLSFLGIGIAQNGNDLAFSGSQIPAGATVIILEQRKKPYDGNPCYSCTATVTQQALNLNEDKIRISPKNDDTFVVTNISGETLSSVNVQFKNYLPSDHVYVGGITYNVTLSDFEADTEVEVTSAHYDLRYTKFVTTMIGE